MAKLSYYIAIYYFSTIVRFLSAEVAKRYTVNNGVTLLEYGFCVTQIHRLF